VESRSRDRRLEPAPVGDTDSRFVDQRDFVAPRASAVELDWRHATAPSSLTGSNAMNSTDNAGRKLGRAKTRHRKRDIDDQGGLSGGTWSPPKLDSTGSPVRSTELQQPAATVLHDGSELEFRAVAFSGLSELRSLSRTGQETSPRARHDRKPALPRDRLQNNPSESVRVSVALCFGG
jgi:hypothetical protein